MADEDDDINLHARTDDPDTSHEAIEGYDLDKMSEAMAVILNLITTAEPHGLADFELGPAFAVAFEKPCHVSLHQQARNQLHHQGRVRDSGDRRENPESGMLQIVWRLDDGTVQRVPMRTVVCPTCGTRLRRRVPMPPPGNTYKEQ